MKTLEESTFRECKNLKKIIFPSTFEKIGIFAFYKTGFENIKLPTSLRVIAQGAFAGCERLRVVEFGEGLEVLGTDEYSNDGRMWHGVFYKSALESVRLPQTLKKIEYNAFKECKRLKTIELPSQLKYIGTLSFAMSGLRSVTFPKSVRTVAQGAFSNCKNLRAAVLNNGLEVLGKYKHS